MSLAKTYSNSGKGMGALDEGVLAKETTIKTIVDFIIKNLPLWAADPKRPQEESENKLNSLLCDFLDAKAREIFPIIRFHHEQPEGSHRQIDLSVKSSKESGILVSGHEYSIYEPFFVMEGKRLPAPEKTREREYLTGENGKTSGGIQRFKIGAHGYSVDSAAIIAYVQKHDFHYWFAKINNWIDDLSNDPTQKNISWSPDDKLKNLCIAGKSSKSVSQNKRSHHKCRRSIKIYHLWVDIK